MLKHCSLSSLDVLTRSSLTVDDLLSVDTQVIEDISDDDEPFNDHACTKRITTNTIRVYATCLQPDLAYRTVIITPDDFFYWNPNIYVT